MVLSYYCVSIFYRIRTKRLSLQGTFSLSMLHDISRYIKIIITYTKWKKRLKKQLINIIDALHKRVHLWFVPKALILRNNQFNSNNMNCYYIISRQYGKLQRTLNSKITKAYKSAVKVTLLLSKRRYMINFSSHSNSKLQSIFSVIVITFHTNWC